MIEARKFEPNIEESSTETKMMICPSCGAKLKPEMKFCNQCGTKLYQQEKQIDHFKLPEAENSANYTPKHVIKSDNVVKKQKEETPTLNLSELPAEIRRAFIFMEDEEWIRAEEYLEPILDEEPENPYAYLGKAMIKAKVISPTNLTNEEIERIQKMRYYYRAKQYADEDLKELFLSWDERVS